MKEKKFINIMLILICISILVCATIIIFKYAIAPRKVIKVNTKQTQKKEESDVKDSIREIFITFEDGTKYSVALEDNSSAQGFAKRLPLTLSMTDLNSNEKYYYFDNSFASNPQKVGKIYKGDLMLYGNDCIVLFYETFETPYSYTRIGKLKAPDGLEEKVGTGSVEVTFSLE